MTAAVLFWILALSCCGYAALYGGWEGRWFAVIYVMQCILTDIAGSIDFHWDGTNWPTFAVDLLLLVGLFTIVSMSRRFWPIWVLGFHLITISAHFASFLPWSYPQKAYFLLATMWAIPKLLIVVAGIHLDRRAGLPST